jgi:shikimate dehydrogenase
MKKFGLLGRHIDYSFSRTYFTNKFKHNQLECEYVNFDIENIEQFRSIIETTPNLMGMNVTIPYKEAIIPFLDQIDVDAKQIGAINTIAFHNQKLTGFNTDTYGFEKSLVRLLKSNHNKALILGTGGASKAVAFTLKKLGIEYHLVSRRDSKAVAFTYEKLSEDIIRQHQLIVNCTPVGTFPKIEQAPKLPYNAIGHDHLLYDLIYNPSETQFLKQGKKKKAQTINGLEMLELQAEKSWEIWNSNK